MKLLVNFGIHHTSSGFGKFSRKHSASGENKIYSCKGDFDRFQIKWSQIKAFTTYELLGQKTA